MGWVPGMDGPECSGGREEFNLPIPVPASRGLWCVCTERLPFAFARLGQGVFLPVAVSPKKGTERRDGGDGRFACLGAELDNSLPSVRSSILYRVVLVVVVMVVAVVVVAASSGLENLPGCFLLPRGYYTKCINS